MPVVIEDIIEGILGGTTWGLGIMGIVAVAAIGGPRAKPLAKSAIKGYFAVTERAREAFAEAGEQLQDIYAEAKHEYHSELAEPAAQTIVVDSEPARPNRRGSANSGMVSPSGQPA